MIRDEDQDEDDYVDEDDEEWECGTRMRTGEAKEQGMRTGEDGP